MKSISTFLVVQTNYEHKVFLYSAFFHYKKLPIASQRNRNKKLKKKSTLKSLKISFHGLSFKKKTNGFHQKDNFFSEISQNSLLALECEKLVVDYLLIKRKGALYFLPKYVVFAGSFFFILVGLNGIFAKPVYAKNFPNLPNPHPIAEISSSEVRHSTNWTYQKLQVKSLPYENTNSSTNFNALVGVGSSISTSNNAVVISNKIDFQTIRSQLTALLETNQPHNDENLINSCNEALNSITLCIKAYIQPILTRYNIRELTLTDISLMTNTRSGLTGKAIDGRDVFISRTKLSQFMERTGLENLYPVIQQTLDDAITFKQRLESAQKEDLQQNIPQIVENFLQKLPTTSEISEVSVRPCVNFKPLKAQLYGKFLDPFNYAVSFDFNSQEVSLGVGKAAFYKLGYLSNNFGVIAGVDFGLNFRFTPSNMAVLSPRYGVNAFLGLGFRF